MPDDEDLIAQGAACPIIRGAYRTGDPDVIAYAESIHPPTKCAHVKLAAEAVRRAAK